MGIGPWRPIKDLEVALKKGDLEMAIAVAKDIAREKGHTISLDLALRMLPLVIRERPEEYDRWALHWFERWLEGHGALTMSAVADVAVALAELPRDIDAFEVLRRAAGR
jgi:hypothetical protein